ncbi:MAG: polysaccharide deacetylase family protein [Syntrophomonadaceae bacterium]
MTARFMLLMMTALIGLIWAAGIPADGPAGSENLRLGSNPAIQVFGSAPLVMVPEEPAPSRIDMVLAHYNGVQPRQWGEAVTGVAYALDTNDKILALTFDLCGGSTRANGYDAEMVGYLEDARIPATFFVSGAWIDANPGLFRHLAANSRFEIGNHGSEHRPLSTNGRQVYGITGTGSLKAAINEVEGNAAKIERLTGRRPQFYRSGTNYYDEVAVAAVRELGYTVVGYSLLGDAGATYDRGQVKRVLLQAKPGSVAIMHANHPESGTAEGVMAAVPLLLANGYRFVSLSDCALLTY